MAASADHFIEFDMPNNDSPSPRSGTGWSNKVISEGRYRLKRKLGEGGMANVFLAEDRNLNSDVVIKVPKRAMLEDASFKKRFEVEIKGLVELRHPHVVSVLDVGSHKGVPFAVMQCLSGGTLLEKTSGKTMQEKLSHLGHWVIPIASAIDFLHGKGYIHRDIKPENILFDDHGHAFLSDFGVLKTAAKAEADVSSRLTQTGVLGTPEYMAPEMILGNEFDGRVDQYALGITVYEILGNRRPFEGESGTAVLVAQTKDDPPFLSSLVEGLPKQVVNVVHKCLSKDPDNRFANCTEFAKSLTTLDVVDEMEETTLSGEADAASSKASSTQAESEQDLLDTDSSKSVGGLFLIMGAVFLVVGMTVPLWMIAVGLIGIEFALRQQGSSEPNATPKLPRFMKATLSMLGVRVWHTQWGIVLAILFLIFKLVLRQTNVSYYFMM